MVVISSVTVGIFGGVFAVAVMNGAIEQKLDASLNEEIAHIHLNDPAFRDNYDMQLLLEEPEKLLRDISSTPGVEAATSRLIVTGMANTARKSQGIQVVGIDPDRELRVFRLHETTMPGTGDFFESSSRHKLVYVGQDLAKELNIIRYRIDDAVLDSLASRGMPAESLEKLSAFKGVRFKNEKSFRKEMKAALTLREQQDWAGEIKKEAWSFRKGSKLTLTFLDREQVQTGGVFRIAGLFDVKNSMFETSQVMVKKEDLAELCGLDAQDAHQVIVRLENLDLTDELASSLAASYGGLEVLDWKRIQPDLAMMSEMITQFYAIFMVIILAALAFGIVNTMLMVVLERTKELGMLTAIGMNKRRVFSLIMLESVFLSLIGGISGMLFSKISIAATAKEGINFISFEEGFEAMGFPAHIYPEISSSFFMAVTILIIITGILSSVYPAIKALKLNPVEALRTE